MLDQVDPSELTERAILLRVLSRLEALEGKVSDLSTAVDDLKVSVDGVASRLLPKVAALEASLADAQATIASDATAAAASLADAASAVSGIRADIDELNALGADPTTPVGP